MGEKSGVLMFCLLLGILVSPSRQDVTALIPIGLKYTFCLTTCVANGTSFEDCIQHCLMPESLVVTLDETYLKSSFGFCIVGCATTTCSRLSTQGRMPAAREVAGCVNTCVERCAMRN